jgi:hypothetical protein
MTLTVTVQRVFDGWNAEIYFDIIAKDMNGVEVKRYKRNDNNTKTIQATAQEVTTALIKKGYSIYDIVFMEDEVL